MKPKLLLVGAVVVLLGSLTYPVFGAAAEKEERDVKTRVADSVPPRPDPNDAVDSMLVPYTAMAHWFVEDLVQLSYLYEVEEKTGRTFKTWDDLVESFEEDWSDWVEYFIGYTLCVTVGVVLIIAMPIVGAIVACCRCCGNCGAKTPPSDKSSDCMRIGCGVALLAITASLAFGAAGLFIANESIKERLSQGDENLFSELSMSIEAMDM